MELKMFNLLKCVFALFLLLPLVTGCQQNDSNLTVTISNELDFERKNETIALQVDNLREFIPEIDLDHITIVDSEGKTVLTQLLDLDQNDSAEKLIFQTDLAASESKSFTLKMAAQSGQDKPQSKVFARFIPERKDDMAWENDRIAFRMYGPALQNTPGEISGSGLDVWVKSVDHLVINKWYEGEDYHTDHGEGCDYYKVGPSRGCGGVGIWEDGELKVSKNFISWKVLANGPIRAVIELAFAPWSLKENSVSEVKTISIDAGSFMNKIESSFDFKKQPEKVQFAVGIVKRKDEGKSLVDKNFVSYWEPAHKKNGSTGCGIIIDSNQMAESTQTKDHYLAIGNLSEDNDALYYAGAGWEKSEYLSGKDDWEAYVQKYALCLNSPVKIEISK